MAQVIPFEVKIGDEIPPLTRVISRDMVIAYEVDLDRLSGIVSREKPSFHADEELASSTMYGAPTAQGILTEALISVMLTRWLADPRGWITGGTLTSKFIAPVWYEDTLTYQARVTDIQPEGDQRRVFLEVWAHNQEGKKVIVGDASALV